MNQSLDPGMTAVIILIVLLELKCTEFLRDDADLCSRSANSERIVQDTFP